jgi:hypothetical protein
VVFIGHLCEEGGWMPANVAQPVLYHHLHRCGRDVRNVPSFSPSLFLAKEFLHG